jgi:hypothetical protein
MEKVADAWTDTEDRGTLDLSYQFCASNIENGPAGRTRVRLHIEPEG